MQCVSMARIAKEPGEQMILSEIDCCQFRQSWGAVPTNIGEAQQAKNEWEGLKTNPFVILSPGEVAVDIIYSHY